MNPLRSIWPRIDSLPRVVRLVDGLGSLKTERRTNLAARGGPRCITVRVPHPQAVRKMDWDEHPTDNILTAAQLVTNGCYCDYNDENGHYGRSPIVRFLIAVN
jgi:hypothetical protein